MNNKKGFSIVEIIVSTGVLTITIFGIYRLIGENSKIITNSNNFLSQNIIFENTKECLKGQNFTGKKFLDFGENFKYCNFENYETIIKIDGIDYLITIEDIGEKYKIKIESSNVGTIEKEIFK